MKKKQGSNGLDYEKQSGNREYRRHLQKEKRRKEVDSETSFITKLVRKNWASIRKASQYPEEKMYESTKKRIRVIRVVLLMCIAFLIYRLVNIVTEKGDIYTRKILTQQYYSSTTIPFKRGDIVDQNGTILATSDKVYNLVVDTKAMLEKEEYVTTTLSALEQYFGISQDEVRNYMENNKTSRYRVFKKELNYDEIKDFVALMNDTKNNPNIQGVWFEEQYVRKYPYNSLACDAIGFTNKDSEGTYGLEEYYNETLSGSNGRKYGYLNDDSTLERTTIAATNGNTIVTTLDMNIQSIVEKNLLKFNEAHKNEAREGEGSINSGCIIMEVDTGNVLAMASYPNYNLNDPYDISAYYTEEQIQQMKNDETYYSTLNQLWRNFCISDTYEPGSVAKPFTAAMGLDSGKITGNETYDCEGVLSVNGTRIRCHNRYGDGTLTVQQAVEQSCNVSFMLMAQTIGKDTFLKYFKTFGFGLKTNIDLAGEARTASLVFNSNTLGPVELATSSFGQGFNVTMIQMISAFCSIVNGGYYYEPHMVSSIQTEEGAVVENIEPRILKQTVSASTSELIRQYCIGVVDNGTGKKARPAGYKIGGKTGTAETVQNGVRDKTNYVVSFMGFAPASDPKIAIYVVLDRPNVESQDTATSYATYICKDILTEVLPYLGIYMTEPLSEEEQQQLNELGIYIPQSSVTTSQDEDTQTAEDQEDTQQKEGQTSEDTTQQDSEEASSGGEVQ